MAKPAAECAPLGRWLCPRDSPILNGLLCGFVCMFVCVAVSFMYLYIYIYLHADLPTHCGRQISKGVLVFVWVVFVPRDDDDDNDPAADLFIKSLRSPPWCVVLVCARSYFSGALFSTGGAARVDVSYRQRIVSSSIWEWVCLSLRCAKCLCTYISALYVSRRAFAPRERDKPSRSAYG